MGNICMGVLGYANDVSMIAITLNVQMTLFDEKIQIANDFLHLGFVSDKLWKEHTTKVIQKLYCSSNNSILNNFNMLESTDFKNCAIHFVRMCTVVNYWN